jgi:hypothetical protein
VHDKRDEKTSEQLKLLIVDLDPRRILLVEGQYGSAGAARNQGLAHVNAKWVCFWDSDDDPKVDNIFHAIHTSPSSEVIIGQFLIVQTSSFSNSKEVTPRNTCQLLDLVSNPGIWRFVFRYEIIKNQCFPSFPLAEDQAFLAQIPWGSVKVEFVKDPFYLYYSGTPFQVTNNKHLVPELKDSVQFLASLPKVDEAQASLIDALILRQSVTMLKGVANPRAFLVLLLSLIKFLLKSSYRGKMLRYGLERLIT